MSTDGWAGWLDTAAAYARAQVGAAALPAPPPAPLGLGPLPVELAERAREVLAATLRAQQEVESTRQLVLALLSAARTATTPPCFLDSRV